MNKTDSYCLPFFFALGILLCLKTYLWYQHVLLLTEPVAMYKHQIL